MRPILLRFGHVQVYAAPVFAGFAAIAAAVLIARHGEHAKLTPEKFWELMLPLAVGTVGGAVVLYWFLWGGGVVRNFEFMLRTHRFTGGAFYGDLLGAILASWWACRRLGLSFRRVGDLLGLSAPAAMAVMRVGCFQNGCCFGKPTRVPWAVVFTDRRSAIYRSLLGVPVHPSQLYEMTAAAVIFVVIRWGVFPRARDGRLPAGSAFLSFLALYGLARFSLDFVRGSDPGVFRPFGLTTAQVLSLGAIAAAAALWRPWRDEPA
ncbi:MAG: prolipoprotein diacylglyceryl transferase [Elusimicrobia bacterium]|nr:prolipoprotein diacylglyceryl transferase [Elusimicrobiota bacterium]